MKCKVGFTLLLGLLTAQTSGDISTSWWPSNSPSERQNIEKSGLVFEDCGPRFDVIAIWLSSCSSVPCVLPHNANVSVSVAFRPNGASSMTPTLKNEAFFILLGARIKATTSPAMLEGISLSPLPPMFHATIHVSPKLPTLLGKLRWELKNDANEMVLCYQLPVRISVR